MTEPNMKIEISLSDDTLAKLAKIFAPAPVPVVPDSLVWKPTTTPVKQTQVEETITSIIEDLVEVPSASFLEAVDEAIDAHILNPDTNQCSWVADRLSKKLRINDKKNDRIGEPYWCQKDAGHKGKHIEGFPPVLLIDSIPDPVVAEQVDDHNQDGELEQVDEIAKAIAEGVKTNPEGRTVVVKAMEGVKGGALIASLKGYVNKLNGEKKCGWWLPAGASYGKFCAATPGHSDSTMPEDHIWTNPAPQMVRA